MIVANFSNNMGNSMVTYGLWQYDYGQILRIQGLNLPTAVEIHFSLRDSGGDSVTRVGATRDGVTDVVIPDSMLENGGAEGDYKIYAFIYLTDKTSGETTHRITMRVNSRPKPEAFDTPESKELFREAIARVNEVAERMESSETNAAKSAETAKENADQTGRDLAVFQSLAEKVEINVVTVEKDRQSVAYMSEQTQRSAENAALSEQNAKACEEFAKQAMTGAETAEDAAGLHAAQTDEDRQVVEAAKQEVMELGQEVAEHKTYVEQTAKEFELKTTKAVSDVEAAGTSQVSNVKTAGETAVSNVQAAQGTGVSAVNKAQEAGVSAVTAAQKTAQESIETARADAVRQVETAKTEGVAAVNAAVENGKSNFVTDETLTLSGRAADAKVVGDELAKKADQTDLEYVRKRQNVLVGSETGSRVCVTDAFEAPLEGLVLYGKSTQVTTTGAQLLDKDALINGIIDLSSGVIFQNDDWLVSDFILANELSNYCISQEKNVYFQLHVGYYDASKNKITVNERNGVTTFFTFSTPETTKYMRIGYSAKVSGNPVYRGNIMLNAGDTALPWEPYAGGKPSPSPDYPQEIVSAAGDGNVSIMVKNPDNKQMQSASFSASNGLPGIPVSSGGNYTDENGQQWICDEVDLERGVYVQRVKTLVFADASAFVRDTTDNGFRFSADTSNLRKTDVATVDSNAFCSILPLGNSGDTWNIANVFTINTRFYIRLENITTLHALDEYFKSTPITLTAILATPIETPLSENDLTAYRALTTYGPTTIVETDGAGIKLDYQRDVNIVIKQLTDTIASMTD